jgi:hypothetical protein
LPIHLPRPRDRTDGEFIQARRLVHDEFFAPAPQS